MKTIITFAAVLLLIRMACAVTNEANQTVLDLGSESGAPISSGFVFVNGRYIDMPYIVSKRGNSIFINEELIETPAPWPLPETTQSVIAPATSAHPHNCPRAKWTRDRVISTLNYFKDSYEKRLAVGDVYFFFTPNSHVSGISSSVNSMIGSLLPILRSDRSAMDKEKELLAIKPSGFNDWQIKILAERFAASDELEKRIKNNEKMPQPKPDGDGLKPAP